MLAFVVRASGVEAFLPIAEAGDDNLCSPEASQTNFKTCVTERLTLHPCRPHGKGTNAGSEERNNKVHMLWSAEQPCEATKPCPLLVKHHKNSCRVLARVATVDGRRSTRTSSELAVDSTPNVFGVDPAQEEVGLAGLSRCHKREALTTVRLSPCLACQVWPCVLTPTLVPALKGVGEVVGHLRR